MSGPSCSSTASLFGIVIAGTVAVLALAPLLSLQAATGAAPVMAPRVGSEAGLYTANAMAGNGVVQELSPGPALAFFLGGVFVIFILLCYEAWLWRKRRSV